MKLVFFDIECAGVHKTYAKICAFGYIVCDENFNILEKEDILINPRGRFELTDRKGEKGIVLPYEYGDFKKQPPFPKVYDKIKRLLEDRDSIVLGHAVLNDVKYLNLETKRFNLPSFKFEFADSQLIFMTLKNDFSHQFGLEHIAAELGVDFTPHRAVDDAYATMRVVEAMCATKDCHYPELASILGFSNGKIENYSITRPQSKGFKKYNTDVRAAKEQRSKCRIKFYNNLSRKRVRKGALNGKVFNFSRAIEDDIAISIPLVDAIYERGGKYILSVEECQVFVKPDGDVTDRAKKAEKYGKEIMLLDDLRGLLNG